MLDDKSGIQALNRSSPLLPICPALPNAEPSTTPAPAPLMFAALDVATGLVIHSIQRATTVRLSSRSSCHQIRSISCRPNWMCI